MKTELVKLVTFRLGADLFAADIFAVERVLRYAVPNHVPDAPAWVEGVVDYRGAVIPVIDMRRRLELPDGSIGAQTRILVLSTREGCIGAIVDAVVEVAVIPAAAVAPPPPLFRGLDSHFLRGVARIRDQLVVVLNVERVLTSADRLAFETSFDVAAQRSPEAAATLTAASGRG